MGFIESLALLAAIGGGAYITVYYVLPALQQMSIAPFYYMQQAAAAQQPAPAPPTDTSGTGTTTQNAEIPDEALDDVTSEEPLDEVVQDAVGDELEDAGLVEEPPEEEKDKKKKSSKSDDDAFKKQQKRHEKTVKSMDPKKDSRYKGKTSKEAGRAALKKLLGYTTYYIGNRYLVVDDANIVREIYY